MIFKLVSLMVLIIEGLLKDIYGFITHGASIAGKKCPCPTSALAG
jgi:hypothetical protein